MHRNVFGGGRGRAAARMEAEGWWALVWSGTSATVQLNFTRRPLAQSGARTKAFSLAAKVGNENYGAANLTLCRVNWVC